MLPLRLLFLRISNLIASDGEVNVSAVAFADNISLQVCAIYFYISIPELAQCVFCGVTVGVSAAYSDHCVLWAHSPQKGVGGGGITSVMAYL